MQAHFSLESFLKTRQLPMALLKASAVCLNISCYHRSSHHLESGVATSRRARAV